MDPSATREQWGSSTSFILATIGSAAGLGNIWRFSYVAGENGGAAFLLAYVLCVLLLGVPLVLAEFSVGRCARGDVVAAYAGGTSKSSWAAAGWLAVVAAFVLLSYYAVVAGWAYKYFVSYLFGTMSHLGRGDYGTYFGDFIARSFDAVLWQFLVVASTVGVVVAGVKRGIEAMNKVLMPMLAAILLLLAGYSLSLKGGAAGLAFLFDPDWSALMRPSVYLAALGQAFFSLGIGAGALLTYGSYASLKTRLGPTVLVVAGGDTLFAIVAGIVIFPAVFAFGLDPAQGPTLAFVTLPEVFRLMPGGSLFAIAFFLLLSLAALTSAVSLLEVPAAVLIRRLNWSRNKSTIIIGAAVFAAGIPSALGFGVLSGVRPFDLGILEAIDHFASKLLLPAGGFLVAIFVGWVWTKEQAFDAAAVRTAWVGRTWRFLLRYVAPWLILLTLAGLILP